MRSLAQKCKGRLACDNGAWFRSRLLKGLHPLTCSFTDVEVRWPLPTLWNLTRAVPIGCGR